MTVTGRPASGRTGRVRSARLTDLAAVGELSRLSHSGDQSPAAGIRTLGLPVGSSHVSVFSLFRLPLGAFLPNDMLYVFEERGKLAGLARVEHEGLRDEWTIVELDAIDNGTAGDIRFRLVQHLLRDATKRGGIRFHVACSDEGGNVELFMQAGFARYGEERILYRAPDQALPQTPTLAQAAELGIRAASPLDALELDRLYRAATPTPVVRLEDYRLRDWERQGGHWRVPRSALTPILRLADVEAFVQESPGRRTVAGGSLLAFCQIGVAKDEQPHYIRVICRPDHDPSGLIAYGLAAIAKNRIHAGPTGARSAHGARRCQRCAQLRGTAGSPARGEWLPGVASVSLLMKEMAERVPNRRLFRSASR